MKVRLYFSALLLLLMISWAHSAGAQAVPSAYGRQLSLTAGGLGSVFQSDYEGGGAPGASPNALFAPGAYVDVQFSRWFGIEAEGRWLRFNQYADIHQDNYLLGYRLPLPRLKFGAFTPYAKVLAGYGKMTFEYNDAHGRFTD